MTAIVIPENRADLAGYKWACDACGFKDGAGAAATASGSVQPPQPPQPPKGYKCPVCGSYDTKFLHTHPLYGDVYHCNGCNNAVHDVR